MFKLVLNNGDEVATLMNAVTSEIRFQKELLAEFKEMVGRYDEASECVKNCEERISICEGILKQLKEA